jgi:hypothetical protein
LSISTIKRTYNSHIYINLRKDIKAYIKNKLEYRSLILSSLFILQLNKVNSIKTLLEQLYAFQMICGTKLKIFYQIKNNTIGRPILSSRKIRDDLVFALRIGCQWKMFPTEYSSGSTCHKKFQEWRVSGIFDKLCGIRLAKIINILKR